MSLKNSTAALEHLLRSSSSEAILVDEASYSVGVSLSSGCQSLRVHCLPVLLHICDSIFEEDFELDYITSSPSEVAFYLHTSGTTGEQKLIVYDEFIFKSTKGHPKLVPITHKNFYEVVEGEQRTPYNELPLYASLPMFHVCHNLSWF